jgi:hypothetical protein
MRAVYTIFVVKIVEILDGRRGSHSSLAGLGRLRRPQQGVKLVRNEDMYELQPARGELSAGKLATEAR